HGILQAASDFEALHEPECNIVTFRYRSERLCSADLKAIGDFNQRIRRRIIESGKFYLVQANLNGGAALRVTLINPLTTEEDLRELVQEIRRQGEDLPFVRDQ